MLIFVFTCFFFSSFQGRRKTTSTMTNWQRSSTRLDQHSVYSKSYKRLIPSINHAARPFQLHRCGGGRRMGWCLQPLSTGHGRSIQSRFGMFDGSLLENWRSHLFSPNQSHHSSLCSRVSSPTVYKRSSDFAHVFRVGPTVVLSFILSFLILLLLPNLK